MVSYELQKVGSPTAMPATSVQTKSMLQKVGPNDDTRQIDSSTRVDLVPLSLGRLCIR